MTRFAETIQAKKTQPSALTLIVDASALMNMAAPIAPTDMAHSKPGERPTLLRYLEHLGKTGVRVIIPESVVFESTGHMANGEQLTRAFEGDTGYSSLRGFLDAVAEGKMKNVRITSTPFADEHLAELKTMKHDFTAFNDYKRHTLKNFDSRDITALLTDGQHQGDVFVVTDGKQFSQSLPHMPMDNKKPPSGISTIKLLDETQRAAPIDWIAPRVKTQSFVGYVNDHYRRENHRRESNPRIRNKVFQPMIAESQASFANIPDGAPTFGDALQAMQRAHRHTSKWSR